MPANAADFTAKLAYVAQPTNPFHKGMEYFAQKVTEKTGGKVEVKLFHSQQLGGERDYIEGLQLGSRRDGGDQHRTRWSDSRSRWASSPCRSCSGRPSISTPFSMGRSENRSAKR